MKPSLKSLRLDEFFILLFRGLCQSLGLHLRDLSRDLRTIEYRLRCEGVRFATYTLSLLGKALEAGLATKRFLCPSAFKRRHKGSALPALLGSHFALVFDDETGMYRDDSDPLSVYVIRQITLFCNKAKYPWTEDQEFQVLDRFVEVERELKAMSFQVDAVLKFAALFVAEVFQDFDPGALSHKHGPGVTSNAKLGEKYDSKLYPRTAASYFGRAFFFNEEDAMTRLDRYPVWGHSDYFVDSPYNRAQVILVPKDSRGPRLISCEPHENQYAQQGIAQYMVGKLESHPYSKGFVNFTDQTINAELATRASLSQEFSTMDLKDASDRVHMDLVRALFSKTPQLLTALERVRSRETILPDGRVVKLAKHAPMGSACCFPVMASCIYFLLFAGLIGAGTDPIGKIFVYGDDIIIRTEFADFAIEILQRYGLRVNKEKSFIDSPFAESCGMDAFKGNEVTPVRLRVVPEYDKERQRINLQASDLLSLLATANRLTYQGLKSPAEFLYSFVEDFLGPLPYGYPHSAFLCRWVPRGTLATAEQLNVDRVRWSFHIGDRNREPTFKAWGTTVDTVNYDNASVWGHLQRIWCQIGREENLPEIGVFDKPKSVGIRRKTYSLSDLSAYPQG